MPARDTFHTYVVKFVAGRSDGTTAHTGALTVWADGADTPVINMQNINTLQRYNGVTQKWMQLWEGDYTHGLPQSATQSFVLTRIGGTLAEALADQPVATNSNATGQFYTGTGTNLGAPSAHTITSRLADQALIPSGLDGAGASPSAPNPAPTPQPSGTTALPQGSPPPAPFGFGRRSGRRGPLR